MTVIVVVIITMHCKDQMVIQSPAEKEKVTSSCFPVKNQPFPSKYFGSGERERESFFMLAGRAVGLAFLLAGKTFRLAAGKNFYLGWRDFCC